METYQTEDDYMQPVPLKSGTMNNDVTYMYVTAVTESGHKSDVILAKDAPYLALTGELWNAYCDD